LKCTISFLAVATACAFGLTSADAGETLRVGKAMPPRFSFVPLDVGMQKGSFKQNGIGVAPNLDLHHTAAFLPSAQ
jgi:ABC-type nitrate/sulfonate/bicarbonate transport system substrate-binding protein